MFVGEKQWFLRSENDVEMGDFPHQKASISRRITVYNHKKNGELGKFQYFVGYVYIYILYICIANSLVWIMDVYNDISTNNMGFKNPNY